MFFRKTFKPLLIDCTVVLFYRLIENSKDSFSSFEETWFRKTNIFRLPVYRMLRSVSLTLSWRTKPAYDIDFGYSVKRKLKNPKSFFEDLGFSIKNTNFLHFLMLLRPEFFPLPQS